MHHMSLYIRTHTTSASSAYVCMYKHSRPSKHTRDPHKRTHAYTHIYTCTYIHTFILSATSIRRLGSAETGATLPLPGAALPFQSSSAGRAFNQDWLPTTIFKHVVLSFFCSVVDKFWLASKLRHSKIKFNDSSATKINSQYVNFFNKKIILTELFLRKG